MKAPVVVIGAGIGGLSAAIRLAAQGQPVVIVEKNDTVGGKMNELCLGNFRWDVGPSVITMRHVFEELFADAGRRMEDYLTLRPVEPLTRYFYPDGVVFDATTDISRMTRQIRGLDERDIEGYLGFLAYAAALHRVTGPAFIYGQPINLSSFSKVSLSDATKIDGLRTMAQAQRSFVRSPHLRHLLGRFATYVGASPYLAPATLNVIAHVEMNEGIWYPEGGVYALARAYQRLAVELGVEIRAQAQVTAIDVKNGQAQGVRLADERYLPARAIIANVDVATVYEQLLPSGSYPARRLAQLQQAEPSCSGFILLLGISAEHPDLAQHNIFFSADYPLEFHQIFEQGIPPTEPTVYVAITSKTTPGDAPAGMENWFVLVNAPALGPGWDWRAEAVPYRNRVLEVLAARGYDVRRHIVADQVLTPVDIAQMTGARRGALYGASSNNRMAAFRRPHNRAPDIGGLYFVGGTTHPGGGVPMVTLSGKVAGEFVLQDIS